MNHPMAPQLQLEQWLNTSTPITLEQLRGKVVVIEAFQMLCPGCVAYGLPQAMQVRANFSGDDVVVLGLHTVFEHHAAQGSRAALAAFLHEYRIPFPVGIDRQSVTGRLPMTMKAFGMQGTPSLVLIDRAGRIRKHKLGHENDMLLGSEVMMLVSERKQRSSTAASGRGPSTVDSCSAEVCRVN